MPIHSLRLQVLEPGDSVLLIRLHQSAVADHLGGYDHREAPLNALFGQQDFLDARLG